MKKLLLASALCLSVLSLNAQAGDPCKAVLCMAGEFMGKGGGSECNDAISEYFGIQVWKKGKFKPSDTAKKRASFLNQCKAEDDGYKDKIGGKFGKVLR